MDSSINLIILLVLVILILVLLCLIFIFYKLLKSNQLKNSDLPQIQDPSSTPQPSFHPAIVERMKQMEVIKKSKSDLFCPNHSEEPGETMCAICDKLYCKSCIKPFKTLHFCKEHLPLIMRHDWDEVLTIKTSTHDPELGVRLYDVKRELFQESELPTYIETHYKINIDQDFIETYLVVYAQKEQIEKTRDFIQLKLNRFQ